MLNTDLGVYISMSPIGARIWKLIESPRNLDEIVLALTAEYDVGEEQCRTEVVNFLEGLQKHGAVTLQGEAET